ncbi:MAG: M20/M25/M40 family metallo-hydrolase [Rhodothermales bacterium]
MPRILFRLRALPVLLASLLACNAGLAQEQEAALEDLQTDVAYLASDLLEGRATGSPGEALAAAYIAGRFEELGLAPGTDKGWIQPFRFRYSANPHATDAGEALSGRNVIGFLDNGAEQTVVIGAHYDHLGYGGTGSLQPGDSLIHNGADDNASGVAALLEIARQLKAAGDQQNNYLFVAFSGEELGLYGSKYFVQNATVPPDEINYMINLDMVGRLGEERMLAVNGTGTSPVWEAALDAAAEQADVRLTRHTSGLGPSDHASFYLEDIPVLHLFTGQHTDYHKPGDDSHLINYSGLYDVASFAVDVIEALDDDEELAFTKTQDESEDRSMAFKVGLGVMPDYVYDGEGLRIDAVLDDRPAARAGLERGDILIRLDTTDVQDIYDYMEALSRFEAGDSTQATVRRGEETIETKIKF